MSRPRVTLALVTLLLALGGPAPPPVLAKLPAAVRAHVTATVSRYFRALKTGSCRRLGHDLTGSAYEAYRTLCEQNRDYPRFLREFNRGAIFWIESMRPRGGAVLCVVRVRTRAGSTSRKTLRLEPGARGRWRITRLSD